MERRQFQADINQDVQEGKRLVHLATAAEPQSCAPPASHDDFSFTISLHSTAKLFQINPDLSPVDNIFFHGRLLPLRPLHEWQQQHCKSATTGKTSFKDDHDPAGCLFSLPESCQGKGESGKSKSFSLFGIRREGRDGEDHGNDGLQEDKMMMVMKKKKSKFDMVKKCYLRLIRLKPGFLSFRTRRGNSDRKEYTSAPVTMRPSPLNSGVFMDSGAATPTAAKSTDSTMEELRAAIQAAIAHCKNSINDDNIQLPSTK